MRNEETEVR